MDTADDVPRSAAQERVRLVGVHRALLASLEERERAEADERRRNSDVNHGASEEQVPPRGWVP